MSGVHPYPEYRESERAWLGSIPKHWQLTPVKHICSFAGGGTPSKENARYWTAGSVPWVSPKDMKSPRIRDTIDHVTEQAVSESSTGFIEPGALLMVVRSGILQRTIPVAINDCRVTLNQDMKALTFQRRYGAEFFAYLVQGNSASLRTRWLKDGATVESVEHDYLANDLVPNIAESEMCAIVSFLDYETARIDALIDKQQQLISLLKEKRQAVISHAVTKGLNPNAKMRDSGVEWLGEVPAHWRTGKMKFFAELRSGHTPSRLKPEYWEDCYIPWFTLADVWQLRDGKQLYLGDTKEMISDLGLAGSAADLLPPGTVILSRTASVGFSGIMPRAMATTQDFVNWIPGKSLRSEFLLFVFRGMASEFERFKMGSTHKTIYMPDVRGFFCPVPPLAEQSAIVTYLMGRLAAFEAVAVRATAQMDLLQERRTALISAAVTGKIDVRNWKAPEAAPEAS